MRGAWDRGGIESGVDVLLSISALLGLGMGAQWIAWRIRMPAIILLLAFGFLAGRDALDLGIAELMDTGLLFPVVSASVALILFEGGLSLRMGDLRKHGRVVTRLITVGALTTWLLTTLAARFLAGLSWEMSLLLGAILIVSGPTVVLPMLRHISPRGRSGPILTWEGIAIDPVGAVLALLVYEGLGLGGGAATGHAIVGLLKTVVIGGAGGLAGGWALREMLRRYWLPDHLHVPVTLALVVIVFAATNAAQHECGLLAVTVMGIYAANSRVSVHHILEFKENLRVLLISSLFILLAARVDMGALRLVLRPGTVGFLLALFFVIRPAGIWLSTRGSKLSREEKIFLAWMCPRGIVAAAVASVFGLSLVEQGVEEAAQLAPLTFLVIVATVVVYGLTAGPLARRLGLAIPDPQGVLLVGAHAWARDMAAALQGEGLNVLLIDANRRNVRDARMRKLPARVMNAIEEHVTDHLDLFGIGRLMALTPNDEVNTLVCMHFWQTYGRSKTYQLPPDALPSQTKPTSAPPQGGRLLFGTDADFYHLSKRFARGRIRVTQLTDTFTYQDLLAQHGEGTLPLFVLGTDGRLGVATVDKPLDPAPGSKVFALVDDPPAESEAAGAEVGTGRP